MMISNIKIDTLIHYAVLSFGLISTLLLFLALKREVEQLAKRHKRRFDQLEARLRNAEVQIDNHPHESFQARGGFHALNSGFNMNHRIQALRLLRRGEDAAHVAAVLGVPRGEVELLIRVQELSAIRLSSRT